MKPRKTSESFVRAMNFITYIKDQPRRVATKQQLIDNCYLLSDKEKTYSSDKRWTKKANDLIFYATTNYIRKHFDGIGLVYTKDKLDDNKKEWILWDDSTDPRVILSKKHYQSMGNKNYLGICKRSVGAASAEDGLLYTSTIRKQYENASENVKIHRQTFGVDEELQDDWAQEDMRRSDYEQAKFQ